jgi:hypothetical protein
VDHVSPDTQRLHDQAVITSGELPELAVDMRQLSQTLLGR